MLEITVWGQLVAEYEGWKIYQPIYGRLLSSYTAINEGIIEIGDTIEEVVEQIASRVGELNRKDDAWSGSVCENN